MTLFSPLGVNFKMFQNKNPNTIYIKIKDRYFKILANFNNDKLC